MDDPTLSGPATGSFAAACCTNQSAIEAAAAQRWHARYVVALAALALLPTACSITPGSSATQAEMWRAVRVVALLDPAQANEAGRCGPTASARVGYYVGGTRMHTVVPTAGSLDLRAGETAYYDTDSPCDGLKRMLPPGVRAR